MLRLTHSLSGLMVGILVAVLAVTGAVLSLEPALERAGSAMPEPGRMNVAKLAAMVSATRPSVERIVRTPSGSVLVYHSEGGRPRTDRIDPKTGTIVAPHEPSRITQFVTNLHRSFLLGDRGRAAAGIAALGIVVLSISGVIMLARRLGGWLALLRPIRGTISQRFHAELGRIAIVGLLLSGLTGGYMSMATFELVPDGMTNEVAAPDGVNSGRRLAVGRLRVLQSVDINDLRELTFPSAHDLSDVYGLSTAHGIGRINAATGFMLVFEPHSTARKIHETIYMLHTGQGLWQLALALGVAAMTVPVLMATGVSIWWSRRRSRPRISNNAPAQTADTIILVGSEGGATWAFASTLHAAMAAAGHKVHVAPMNALAASYRDAERLLLLTSTYGDGAAPATADRFLSVLHRCRVVLPFAVLGFGDRAFPQFCQFAEAVETALRAKGWPALTPLGRIDRQSAQEFSRWGQALGEAIGTPLVLEHQAARPRTTSLALIERTDYGRDVQAPTAALRFAIPQSNGTRCLLKPWRRRSAGLPKFQAGDIVGIVPPNSNVPRFYSLASSSEDGVLEICVRKQNGGLCSGFLHGLSRGDSIDAFIRPNPAFRPSHGKAPLVLIGAGAGIGPLVGIIRRNSERRPVHLYWGGRHPGSDFLYEGDLSYYLSDRRLTRCRTTFSRLTNGLYVQDRITMEANVMRDLIRNGAQIMVCGGRDMAGSVASAIDGIVRPIGLDLAKLKSKGRYLEDVY